jgi:hypothetical protein
MKSGKGYTDVESGLDEPLYPRITVSEQGLRWGFIQKVRGRWWQEPSAASRVVAFRPSRRRDARAQDTHSMGRE